MSILGQVPGPRPMRADHRSTLRRELEALASNPSRRWRWRRPAVVIGLAISVAAAGGTAAAAYAHFAPVTNTNTAFCYSVPSTVGHKGSEVAAVGDAGSPAQVTNALQACSTLWRDGFLVLGSPNALHIPVNTTVHPLPKLVVCTMPDGTAGVFPGDASTCALLGLPTARRSGDGTP
jgi:hypothetical protein